MRRSDTLCNMAVSPESPPSLLADYQLRLPAFEGPLDVLLHLIEHSQMAITDISLAAVTDQFLAHIEAIRDAPPNLLAEFIGMGARLTVLKSRSLLPRPAVSDEDVEPSDLVRQLVRYRHLREVAEGFRAYQHNGLSSFAANGDRGRAAAGGRTVRLAEARVETLSRALRRRLATLPRPSSVLHQRRIVTIREMVEQIVACSANAQSHLFTHVLAGCRTRSEMATAFLAVLILVRRQSIDAQQSTPFGEITLVSSPVNHAVTEPAPSLPIDNQSVEVEVR